MDDSVQREREIEERIIEHVEARREEICALLSRLVQFKTVNGEKGYEGEIDAILDFIGDRARDFGLHFEKFESTGKKVGILEWGANGDNPGGDLGILCHADVVPTGKGWRFDPFAGTVSEGRIWGRGTQDDKISIVGSLVSFSALKLLENEISTGGESGLVRAIIGTQEEGGDWSDLQEFFTQHPPPTVSLVPDGEFPLINGEKGMMNLIFTEHNPPADPDFILSGGTRSNIVPQEAYLRIAGKLLPEEKLTSLLDAFLTEEKSPDSPVKSKGIHLNHSGTDPDGYHTIRFEGKAAHSSQPWKGMNAVAAALRFAFHSGLLHDSSSPSTKYLRLLNHIGQDWKGKALGIAMDHPEMEFCTSSLNVVQMKGDSNPWKAVCNVRHIIGQNSQMIAEAARKVVRDFNDLHKSAFRLITGEESQEPFYVSADRLPVLFGILGRSYEKASGKRFFLKTIGGTTYAKAVPLGFAFGPIFPGSPELAHQVDEYISVEELVTFVKIYALALHRFRQIRPDKQDGI
jgi:succinyl-diaminopimelate desuccinylase